MLKDATFLNGLGCEQPKGGVVQEWGKELGIFEGEILVVAEDNDANLGTVWFVVAVAFDYQVGHGWDGAGALRSYRMRIYSYKFIMV